jgi:hypothetical protein
MLFATIVEVTESLELVRLDMYEKLKHIVQGRMPLLKLMKHSQHG